MACLIHLTDASREDESDIQALLQSVHPHPGLRVSGKHVEFIIGMVNTKINPLSNLKAQICKGCILYGSRHFYICSTCALQRYGADLLQNSAKLRQHEVEGNPPYAIRIGPTRLRTFQKVHCLPFADTFKYNFDHLYNDMLVPYFTHHQTGEFGVGHEFAMKGVRFRVIGTEPEGVLGVVGAFTMLYFEGTPITRPILTLAHIVPYKSDLPAQYLSGHMLNEDAILRDYLKPYFDQNSHLLRVGQELDIKGCGFRVLTLEGGTNNEGGVGDSTKLLAKGIPIQGPKPPVSSANSSTKTEKKCMIM